MMPRRPPPNRPLPVSEHPQPPAWRTLLGGFLMGLANLVPGVSGGTMILALGLYDRFIAAVAELTSLRWSRGMFVFLTLVAVGLIGAFLTMSGPAVWLVSEHRWIAYSLFIGLTLGGVPELLKLCGGFGARVVVPTAIGLAFMVWLAASGARTVEPTIVNLVWVGALAASSMILPGVSGSLLLLIFGLYGTVIGSLSLLKSAPVEALETLVPVGVGAALGIAILANVLKRALEQAPRVSHGLLLGLLVGSVVGLMPFQQSTHPDLATRDSRKAVQMLVVEGAEQPAIEAEYAPGWSELKRAELEEVYGGMSADDLKRLSIELERFSPEPMQVAAALGLVLLGGLLTAGLGRGSSKGAH